ncbi:hypothetical protein [Sphingobium algorifonticola]|uniref:Uncharacterized protein n=1 Tax=Sphingobium algorifonticola TaxID=2008318 RepID=A0A437J9Y1_9SPHN|nr:hypothetical protein [Sphingobium algorifonticola]RVT42112.1 hypothetical protein ENE74_07755 [Sphingobium algorifonticola]
MSNVGFLSSLSLVTLLIVLGVAAITLVVFLRKRSNRHPLEGKQERNVAADIEAGKSAPDHSPPK